MANWKITLLVGTLLILAFVAASANAQCELPELRNQRKDVATVLRLENEWNSAFLRGDTGLMSCLLAPDFTEIMRSGELKKLPDELAMAEKNRGKGLKMPELPTIRVLLYGNAAVAYGRTIVNRNDAKSQIRWYSDTYLWKNEQWHAFFAQQTAAQGR